MNVVVASHRPRSTPIPSTIADDHTEYRHIRITIPDEEPDYRKIRIKRMAIDTTATAKFPARNTPVLRIHCMGERESTLIDYIL